MTIYIYQDMEIDSDELTKDDMPTQTFQEIFELCGVDVALALLFNMQGNVILVPTSRIFRKYESRVIKDAYDGSTASIRALARKFKITERQVREILNEHKMQVPAQGQLNLNLIYK
ncbi:hypothetical protein IJ531_03300 [bacterium]|nr:hypothetical protein [bacterium]